MVARKRQSLSQAEGVGEPVAKRRSSRRLNPAPEVEDTGSKAQKATEAKAKTTKTQSSAKNGQPAKDSGSQAPAKSDDNKGRKTASKKAKSKASTSQTDATVPEPAADSKSSQAVPDRNPEAPRHDGEWYWLMKAEPESRFENGIDVRFSIDDLRAKKEPEGWDGIRAYAARNHMRNMNLGDKAFFYHSNCKEPGIVGIMEIVKEFSEDKTALQPGTPYYDPKSTPENPRWSLVHVEFRKKFAVPITLKELRDLGASSGSPLAEMQMLKQSRLSVSRVSSGEWETLCDLADEKAREAGLEHEEGPVE